MAQGGYWIDTTSRIAGRLDIERVTLDRLEIAGNNLYCARHVDNEEDFTYRETWIISARCWTVNRFTFRENYGPGMDFWKLEPDPAVADGPMWRVTDGFLDVHLFEGCRYDLLDADEFADALRTGDLSSDTAAEILYALEHLCRELETNGYSGQAILRKYAQGLPE